MRTVSATADLIRAASVPASYAAPASLARSNSIRSSGRGRLPVWVVRIRWLLRFIDFPPLRVRHSAHEWAVLSPFIRL